jgi:hypothetical protein
MLPICLHLDCSSSPLVTLKELKEWDLHTTKLSKEHTKHELSAHLSTSPLLVFSSGILQRVGRGRFALPKLSKEHITHESNADLSTSRCYPSSPLVSSKYIVCNIVKADSFFRTNLMVKDIRFISYGCMFVATSLSSPTFTADCTWTFMLHLLREWDLHTTKLHE